MSRPCRISLAIYNPLMSDIRWVVGSFRGEEMCRALSDVGIEGIVASPFLKKERRISSSFTAVPLPLRMDKRLKSFLELVRSGGYDIVQERPIGRGVSLNGFGLAASVLEHLPFVLELHNLGTGLDHIKRLPVQVASVLHSDLILSYSGSKGLALLGADSERILEVPNGYSAELVNSVVGREASVFDLSQLTDGRRAFGYFGTLSREKCVDLILEVAERMSANRDICFVFAGTGPLEEKVLEMSRKTDSNVIFTGLLDRRKAIACMSQCRATFAIHDSSQSAIGNPVKVVESLALGVTPITTIDYVMSQELKNDCVVLNGRDSDEISNAVTTLSSSSDGGHISAAIDRYSIEYIARDIVYPAYLNLLKQHHT